MAKEVTFEIDADSGTLVQDGALFVGGQATVNFSGYGGTSPILILFQRRPGNVLAPIQITQTPEGAAKPQLDLNNVAARECFAWNNRERPQAKVVLEAYLVDGESVEVKTVESVSTLVITGSKWILASGQAQIGWAPVNFEADGTAVSLKGDKGDAGAQGERGATGEAGPQGPRGERGEKGEKGDKGDKGDAGAQGAKGEKGDKGDQGSQGERGEKGEKGEQGERGYRGDKGDKGEKGDKGDKGDAGAQGAVGPKGDKGDAGAQGEKGEKGDKGEQGERGYRGDKGDKGDQGERGNPGEQGQRGLSAYEIARLHGYTGTEAQWVAEETGLHYALDKIHDALTGSGEALDVIVESLNAMREI